MKESITKFDLEAAFKALDEIDVPKVGSVKANRPALNEIFSRKTKFDALMEEYYDVGSMEELGDAKESREAEVAQAKLARIEKIVDLDAESPEDLLPSYVGKFIMQCPQCMTLFYKNPEDIEASEEDPDVVNVAEVCQHCGNESGYTLIGKVGAATDEEMSEYTQEETVDVTSTEEGEEELPVDDEMPVEEPDEELDIDLDELDLDIEDDEEEKTEESFNSGGGNTLVEELYEDADEIEARLMPKSLAESTAELDVSADEFEELINSPEFKKGISDAEARAMLGSEELPPIPEEKVNIEEDFKNDFYDDVLTDNIEDMLYYGKFLNARWKEGVPSVERLKPGVYRVTHANGGTDVIVKFDLSNKADSTLKFTVNGKPFTTKYANEAQDFVIQELEAARTKSFNVAVDESMETLEEGIFDKFKKPAKKNTADDQALKPAPSNNMTVPPDATKVKGKDLKVGMVVQNDHHGYGEILSIGDRKPSVANGYYVLANTKFKDITKKVRFQENEDYLVKKTSVEKESLGALDDDTTSVITEGVFDKLKDKFKNTIDGISSKLPTREAKADWILANAQKSYNNVKLDGNGKITVDEANRKYTTYVTMGLSGEKAEEGKPGVDKNSIKYFTNYKQVDMAAKGWSLSNGNAYIYLAANKEDRNPQFICEYQKGKLMQNDRLEKLFKEVKTSLKGAKLMATSTNDPKADPDVKMPNDEENTTDEAGPTEITAAELKPGMKFEINGEKVEFVRRGKLKNATGKSTNTEVISVKKANGKQAVYAAPAVGDKILVFNEDLNVVFDNLEELHESYLEKLISESLIESYGNVAGFRLTECAYENSKFVVDGTIYFTSGNKRSTSYIFTEAAVKHNKIYMRGLNEKLGTDKCFTITGRADNKTFITESFKATKK